MNLSAIQSHVAGRIAAVPALAAFGAAIQFDPLADPKTSADAIDARVRATGVCIEIDVPGIERVSDPLGASTVECGFDVYVSESLAVTHSPEGLALVDEVIGAIRHPAAGIRLAGYEPARTAQGALLHIISFAQTIRSP